MVQGRSSEGPGLGSGLRKRHLGQETSSELLSSVDMGGWGKAWCLPDPVGSVGESSGRKGVLGWGRLCVTLGSAEKKS